MVLSTSFRLAVFKMPALFSAEFSETVLLTRVSVPLLAMPPPLPSTATLSETVVLVSVSVPSLTMPPPELR